MSFINRIFGSDEKVELKSDLNWIPLNDKNQLTEIKNLSKNENIFIFKHSTRCGISSMVKKQFEKLFKEEHSNLKVYYLDLLKFRDLSNEISNQFKVIHQSPQLLVINAEISIFSTSHYDITEVDLSRFL